MVWIKNKKQQQQQQHQAKVWASVQSKQANRIITANVKKEPSEEKENEFHSIDWKNSMVLRIVGDRRS